MWLPSLRGVQEGAGHAALLGCKAQGVHTHTHILRVQNRANTEACQVFSLDTELPGISQKQKTCSAFFPARPAVHMQLI